MFSDSFLKYGMTFFYKGKENKHFVVVVRVVAKATRSAEHEQ